MATSVNTSAGFHASVPVRLFETGLLPTRNHPYAVSGDGQRLLIPVTINPPGPTPVTVILNWPATLP